MWFLVFFLYFLLNSKEEVIQIIKQFKYIFQFIETFFLQNPRHFCILIKSYGTLRKSFKKL